MLLGACAAAPAYICVIKYIILYKILSRQTFQVVFGFKC